MRIALITTYPPSTGTLNEYGHHFVRYLQQKQEIDEIILLVDALPDETVRSQAISPGVPLQIIPCWSFGAANNALRILRAVRAVQPDIVLFNIQFATFGHSKAVAAIGLMTPFLLKTFGFPTVVLMHNIMETVDLRNAGFGPNKVIRAITQAFGTLITRFILSADLVALTMPKYVELLESKYGATNVVLAPHGAFEEAQPPSFELPPGRPQIMTFGKFGTYKRIETLIEAFKLLNHNQRPLELVIAGTDSPNTPGYLDAMRQRYADVVGLRFTGYVSEENVACLFQDAAVVVFPYTSTTGSSGVLHQAGNYGKAVVLPRLGDLAELVAEEGYTGMFCQPDDPQSMADAIGQLLNNPLARHQMGMQNYLAAHGLPMSDVVDWYLLHMQAILARRSGIAGRPQFGGR